MPIDPKIAEQDLAADRGDRRARQARQHRRELEARAAETKKAHEQERSAIKEVRHAVALHAAKLGANDAQIAAAQRIALDRRAEVGKMWAATDLAEIHDAVCRAMGKQNFAVNKPAPGPVFTPQQLQEQRVQRAREMRDAGKTDREIVDELRAADELAARNEFDARIQDEHAYHARLRSLGIDPTGTTPLGVIALRGSGR